MRKRLAIAFVWLAVWQLASMAVHSGLLFPSPLHTALRLVFMLGGEPRTWLILGVTALRVLVGLGLGLALALASALATRLWPWVDDLLELPLSVLKSTPVACAIVLILLWVGSAHVSTAIVFVVVFPAMYFATKGALEHPNVRLDELLQVMRVPAWRKFFASVWPSVVPYVRAAARSACGMAWKSCVAAEVIGMPALGVGERIYQAKLLLDTADVFAWTVLVILSSYVMERSVLWLLDRSQTLSLKICVVGLAENGAIPDTGLASAATVGEKNVLPRAARCHCLSVGYGLGHNVVEDLTFEVPQDKVVALSDGSGAGKTTLVKALCGLLVPSSGKAEGFAPVSVVLQEPRLVEGLSAVDNVMLCAAHGCDRPLAVRLLERLLPEADLAVRVSALSGGQRRRVELVRALLAPSNCLVLDEPFSSLDRKSAAVAAELILEYAASRPVLVATHVMQDVQNLCAQTITLSK